MNEFWTGPDGLMHLAILAKYLVNEEGYDGDDIARAISTPWHYNDEFVKAMHLYDVPGAPPLPPTPPVDEIDDGSEELIRGTSERITPDQIADEM